jgi:arylsulfatase A-like enzyme
LGMRAAANSAAPAEQVSAVGDGLFTGELAGRTPNLAQPTAEGMMFTAHYLRRAVGRANFITGRARIRTGLTTRWTGRSDRRYAGAEL